MTDGGGRPVSTPVAALRRYGARDLVAGLTLIEVLVSLSIVALALMTGIKAVGALGRHSEWQLTTLLAQACAENALVEMRLLRTLPDLGMRRSACLQSGQVLDVEQGVQATPNPRFRRVVVSVQQNGHEVLRMVTLAGRAR